MRAHDGAECPCGRELFEQTRSDGTIVLRCPGCYSTPNDCRCPHVEDPGLFA